MTISRGIVFSILLVSGATTSSAQSVPGVPMTGKIHLEQSLDGRSYRLVSETDYYRDSLGRVRAEEKLYDASGRLAKRTVRIARVSAAGRLMVITLDPEARTTISTVVPDARLTIPPPPGHRHPKDGTRFGGPPCVFGMQRFSVDFPGIEILRCDRVAAGVNRRFARDGFQWRETIAEARAEEPPASLFEIPSGFVNRDVAAAQMRLHNDALRQFYQLQPPPREPLLQPLPPVFELPELRRPTFVPGEECDEFRLAGKELVTWNCKEKESLLLRAQTRRIA